MEGQVTVAWMKVACVGMVQVFSVYKLVLTLDMLYERSKKYESLWDGTDAFGVNSERFAQALATLYNCHHFLIIRIPHTCSHDPCVLLLLVCT